MSRRRERYEQRRATGDEPAALSEAFRAIEQAERVADRGFRRVLELLNPERDRGEPRRDGGTRQN